jgi:hypothetical protein
VRRHFRFEAKRSETEAKFFRFDAKKSAFFASMRNENEMKRKQNEKSENLKARKG